MKISKKKAKELSIIKWEYIVGNNGKWKGLYRVHPELNNLAAGCGYCEKYGENNCDECPLLINNDACTDPGHPFHTWTERQTKENAQAVLDLILKS